MTISEAKSEKFKRRKFKPLGRKSISNTKRSIFEAKGPCIRNKEKFNIEGKISIFEIENPHLNQ
jgi:hypothetical protein